MIKWIIDASLRDRLMVLLATFIVAAVGYYSYVNVPLDAIPDLSDVQVIVLTEYPGQSPQVVEDQVTYPLTTTLLGIPDPCPLDLEISLDTDQTEEEFEMEVLSLLDIRRAAGLYSFCTSWT